MSGVTAVQFVMSQNVQLVWVLAFHGISFVFLFFQEMRHPQFPAAFVFWLRLWMPGSQMTLLTHSAYVNLTLPLVWLHQCLASTSEDEVAAVIEPLKHCSYLIAVDVTFSLLGTAALMHDVEIILSSLEIDVI